MAIKLYFADPYCSHQRGSNEHGNGFLREFFPKNTDLGKVSQQELCRSLFLINSRPRKCLGWLSPLEALFMEMSQLT